MYSRSIQKLAASKAPLAVAVMYPVKEVNLDCSDTKRTTHILRTPATLRDAISTIQSTAPRLFRSSSTIPSPIDP